MSFKRHVTFVCFTLTFFKFLPAGTGIAAHGGFLYPGVYPAEESRSRFRIGPGFDFTLRHQLIKLNPSFVIDSRYSIRNYYCDIILPYDGTTRFHFSYLSIDLTMPVYKISRWQFYSGVGLSLTNVSGVGHYFRKTITDTALLPDFIGGVELLFGKNFNLFIETMIQYGEVDLIQEQVPVHGFKISLGGTMFFSSEP